MTLDWTYRPPKSKYGQRVEWDDALFKPRRGGNAPPEHEIVTDGAGRFEIVVNPKSLFVCVGESGCPAYRTTIGDVKARPGETVDVGDIAVDPSLLVIPHAPSPFSSTKYPTHRICGIPLESDGHGVLAGACCDLVLRHRDGAREDEFAGFGFTDSNGWLKVAVPIDANVELRAVHFDGFHAIEFRCENGDVKASFTARPEKLDRLVPIDVRLTDSQDRAPANPIEMRWSEDGSTWNPYFLASSIAVDADGAFRIRFPPAMLCQPVLLEAREAGSEHEYCSIGRTNPDAGTLDARRRWRSR